MIVYLLVIIMLYIMHNNVQKEHDLVRQSKLERKYVFWATSVLVLLAALRWIIPGSDADSYMEWYRRVSEMSFAEVAEERDLSYVYFISSKVFSLTGLSFRFWFAFIEIIYLIAFLQLIKKFTSDRLLCLFILFNIGLFSFSFNGMKQTLAMALIWFGFSFLYEKKYFWAVVMVVLSYFCHKTSMVFLIAYLMPSLSKMKNTYYVLIVSVVTILLFSYSSALVTMSEFLGDDHYMAYLEEDTNYNSTVLIYNLILLAMAYFTNDRYKTRNVSKENRLVIGLALISVFTQLFAFRVASAFRLALYFQPFLAIYLANRLERRKDMITTLFVMGTIWLLYTGRNFPYKFFWQ